MAGAVDLGFEVEDANGVRVILTQGATAAVLRLRQALDRRENVRHGHRRGGASMSPLVRMLRWTAALWAALLAVSGVLAVLATLLFFASVGSLPRVPEPLRRIIETPPTEIFAANGERVFQIGGRDFVTLNQTSRHLVEAILAVEDHRFWEHRGVNKLRTMKALWITLFSPGRVQGASTITQQLAKNLFFSFEKTFTRKFKELLVALQIESQFSKQEILEAYLNQIYFGPGCPGASARRPGTFSERRSPSWTWPRLPCWPVFPNRPPATIRLAASGPGQRTPEGGAGPYAGGRIHYARGGGCRRNPGPRFPKPGGRRRTAGAISWTGCSRAWRSATVPRWSITAD